MNKGSHTYPCCGYTESQVSTKTSAKLLSVSKQIFFSKQYNGESELRDEVHFVQNLIVHI